MTDDVRTWAAVLPGDEILGGWTVDRKRGSTVDLSGPAGTKRGSPRADSVVTITRRGELGRVVDMFAAAGLELAPIREW